MIDVPVEDRKESRKDKRKKERKLKKMRMNAFCRRLPIPTKESVATEEAEEEKRQKKIAKQRKRNKAKLRNKKERKLQEKKEAEEKEMELKLQRKQDGKLLKDLEKKLFFKKGKGLPASFARDNIDYVLNYMEDCHEFSSRGQMGGGDDDDDEDGGDDDDEDDGGDDDDDDDEYSDADDDDGNDDREIQNSDIRGSKKVRFSLGDDDDEEEEEVEDGDDISDDHGCNGEDDDDDGNDDDDDAGCHGDDDDEDDDSTSLKVNFQQMYLRNKSKIDKETSEHLLKLNDENSNKRKHDDDDDDDDDDNDNNDDDDDGDEDKVVEDIYGRLKTSSGRLYIPPAKRMKHHSTNSSNDKLNKMILNILNKLNENNMVLFCNELDELFMKNSRQDLSHALESGISKLCLTSDPCTRSLAIHCCFMMSVLHFKVGPEISASFLQYVVSKFLNLFKSYDDSTPTTMRHQQADINHEMNNCLLFICQLYDYKVIESVLIMDLVDRMLNRFSIVDINLISLLLKEAGPRLRKEDSVTFKEILQKVMKMSNKVKDSSVQSQAHGAAATDDDDDGASKKKLLADNMISLLTILKNNQMHKISTYDADGYSRRWKLFQSIVKSKSSYPLRVSLEDIELSDTRGKWWLVGSAWNGRNYVSEVDANVEDTDAAAGAGGDGDASGKSRNAVDESSDANFESHLLEKARLHKMNTALRATIFCTIMSSEDYKDAFERLMSLNLKPEQQHEIMAVIVKLCVQGKEFNAFYVYLAQQLCRHHRRYMIACKFSVWDHMKITSVNVHKSKNLADFIKMMLSMKALPINVLKNINFSELDAKMTRFVDRILRYLLTRCEIFLEVFRPLSTNPNDKTLRTSLALFLRHFYVNEYIRVKKDDDDDDGDHDDRATGGDDNDDERIWQIVIKNAKLVLSGLQDGHSDDNSGYSNHSDDDDDDDDGDGDDDDDDE